MIEDVEQRIMDLEIHVAHQADTLETLNQVVTSQAKTIDRLMNSLNQMKELVTDLQDLVDQAPADRKPPHY
ncbi:MULTISPECIES: SlyX family protein [Pseudovibrio]|uniref:SlyX family protein n=1 Tax=Stappiaceae TaxID=2821832 RepID=UPI002366781A|nr:MULTISPECIES: SlyX family protein [Pseudovibrio]MDD7908987.1 SlyX family protein [Pseudovibrio exalbescens]MDX5593692.1 SlyX family protein [Pseudovibrio sp. SPO723]